MARMLIVPMRRGDVDLTRLSGAQKAAARLPHALAGYLAWLAPRMPNLPQEMTEFFAGSRAAATVGAAHLRIPEAIAHCWVGFAMALQYAEEIGARSSTKADALRRRAWDAFLELGVAQARLVDVERPTRQFLTTLATLITQRRVFLLDRRDPRGLSSRGGDMIGWEDAEASYLLAPAALGAVSRFCRKSGEPLAISADRLRRELADEGLSECDPDRHSKVVKVMLRSNCMVLTPTGPLPLRTGNSGNHGFSMLTLDALAANPSLIRSLSISQRLCGVVCPRTRPDQIGERSEPRRERWRSAIVRLERYTEIRILVWCPAR